MRVSLLLLLISSVYSVEDSNSHKCPPLYDPVGSHPASGHEVPAGVITLREDGDDVVATVQCDEDKGFVPASGQPQQMRCSWDEARQEWAWDHHHRQRRTPTPRCSRLSPKPLLQTFKLGKSFAECDNIEGKMEVEEMVREEIMSSLTCVMDQECTIREVECVGNEVKVIVKSTMLNHLEKQQELLQTAAQFLGNFNFGATHGRHKRSFDDFESADTSTDSSSCSAGEITQDGACVQCSAGTYANSAGDTCVACGYGEWSAAGATECTACTGSLSTLDTQSTQAEDCVDVCVVGNVGFASMSDTRILQGSEVTLTCNTDYSYGNSVTTILTCDTAASSTDPDFPTSCRKVSVSSTNPAVEVSTTATVTCTVEAADAGTGISWYKDGSSTALVSGGEYTIATTLATEADTGSVTSPLTWTSSSTLQIPTFASEDVGSYSCQVDYTAPILDDASGDQDMSVLDVTLTLGGDAVQSEGGSVDITCSMAIDSTYSNTAISWKKDSSAVTSGFTETTNGNNFQSVLSLSDVTLSATAIYQCDGVYSLSDGSGPVTISKTQSITVRGFSEVPEGGNFMVGDAVTLSCSVDGEAQASSMLWAKVKDSVSSTVDATSTNFVSPTTTITLEFASATEADAGSYACVAIVGGATLTSDAVTVNVYDIGVSTDPVDAAFGVGEDASLSCTVKNPTNLDSDPIVSWYKVVNSAESAAGGSSSFDPSTGVSTLTFSSASVSDGGQFKCKATYSIGGTDDVKESGTAMLYIMQVTLKNVGDYVSMTPGSPYTFTCLYEGNQAPTANPTWSYQGSAPSSGVTHVPYASEAQESEFVISSVSVSSGGVVSCSFSFTTGGPLTASTSAVVRSLTSLGATKTSGDATYTITCEYSGTDDADSVTWFKDGTVLSSGDANIAITPGSLSGGTRSDKLEISGRTYSDAAASYKCKWSFSNPTQDLETSTTLSYRGLVAELNEKYYSTGGDMTMQCSMGVGASGPLPTVAWTKDSATLPTGAGYTLTTDTSVTNGLFQSTLVLSSVTGSTRGSYKCEFTVDGTPYPTTGVAVVRIVTATPSQTPIVNNNHATFVLTCTLDDDASETTPTVAWSGPDGALNSSGESNTGDVYTYTFTNPTSSDNGDYTCSFTYTEGLSPSGTFTSVTNNILTMTSQETIYATFGTSVTVTIVCEVSSESVENGLSFKLGETPVTSSDVTVAFASGKTTATHEVAITTYQAADAVYTCTLNDDVSPETSTIKVMNIVDSFDDITRGNDAATQDLYCQVTWDASVMTKPTIAWTLDGTAVSGATPSDEGADVRSTLAITISSANDEKTYTCTVSYTAVVGGTFTRTTKVIMNKLSILPAEIYEDVGETATFTCVGTWASGVGLQWKRGVTVLSSADEGITVQTATYDTAASTLTSELQLSALSTASSADDYSCSDTGSLSLTSSVTLGVVDVVASGGGNVHNLVSATLTCTFTGLLETAVVTWTIVEDDATKYVETQGSESSGSQVSTLEIKTTVLDTLSATATYTCSVTLGTGSKEYSQTNTITVFTPALAITSAETTGLVYEDNTAATLTCTVSSLLSDETVLWYNGATAIGTSDTDNYVIVQGSYASNTKTSTLVIQPQKLKTLTDKTFKCSAVIDTQTVESPVVTLTIYAIGFSTPPVNSAYDVGDGASLSCIAKQEDQLNGAIQWFKKGDSGDTEITASAGSITITEETTGTSILTFVSGAVSDSGTYYCKATYDIGGAARISNSDPANLYVRDLTELAANTYSEAATETITCVYSGTVEPDTVTWTIDSTTVTSATAYIEITPGSLASNSRTDKLEISNRKYTDANKSIKCKYDFSDPVDSLETTTVLAYRGMIDGDATLYNLDGSAQTISCQLGVGSTDTSISPAVVWSKGSSSTDSWTTIAASDASATISTDASPTDSIFSSELRFASPVVADGVEYKCEFTPVDGSGPFSRTTTLIVRSVTVTPTPSKEQYSSAAIPFTCSLAQSATDTAEETSVTVTGPSLESAATVTKSGADYPYSVTSPVTGQYQCTYNFGDGQNPVGNMAVIVNLISMVEETVYTAYSDSASVTLSCEVESTSPVSLVFDTADGTAGSTRVGTKTTATITLDVTAYEADRTYSCAVGSETSVGTTKLVVMELTQMSEITRGKSGSTTDLVCTTSWYDDLTHPTISWKKRSTVDGDTTPIFVPQAVTTPNSVANTFESKLSFTLNENVDNLYYLCEVEYEASEVANADDKYSSQTQIILYQITVTPQDAFEDSGDNVAFVCVATVASTTSLEWSSIGWDSSAGYVGYGTSLFTETYDAGKGQMTSTLTLNAVTTLQSTESIKCLDSASLGIEATTSLVVVDVTVTGDTDVTNLAPATITCTFSGLLDDTVVTWSTTAQSDLAANELSAKYTVDTAAWTKGATVSDPSTMVSKLTIQRSELTSLTTATVYTCSINPSNNPFEGTQTITVSKPEIELENTIWDFISTEDAVITCTLSNILESATISWTTGAANTAVVDDTTNFVITPTAFNSNMQKSTLTIKSAKLATLTDTYFKCSAVVGEDTLSADATLNVFSVADSFEDTTNYKMYVDGATLTLTCTFTGGDLLSNIEWQKDGTALSDTSNVAGVYVGGDKEWESTLDLTSVEPSDGGSYSCVFKFKSTHEDITRSTNVVLFDFVDLESSYFSPKSMSVTFRGTFEPTVTWMVDSTEYDAAVNTNLEIVEAEWAGNEITFTLNTLEQSSYASFTLQAVLNFTPAETSETITSTTATVYKREFTTELPATATFGPEDSDGLPITFTCVAAGEDVTKFAFTWFIGETEIAASGTEGVSYTDTSSGQARTSELVITSNDQKYNGMLKCVATWTDTSTSISSMSDVDAIGASIDEYTFDTGSGEAILSCVVWGNTAPTSVSWTDADSTAVVAKADKYVIADEAVGDIRTYTLKIENLQFADQGVYTCTVEFDSENTLTYATEVVKLSASFEPASPYFAHDGTVHFTCIYTGAATPDKVEWFKGDDDTAGNLIDPATTTADYTITSDLDAGKSMFTIISPTAADDTGDYTCKWTLPSGSVRNPMATMTVAVRSIAMDATTLSTDGNLALTCTLTSVETGTVKWYYKGTEVTDQSGMGATGTTPNWEFTYSITDVNPEDNAGSYKCELSFVDGDELSATTEVTIRKVSIIDSEGATMENYIASDSTVKLICMTEADEVPETVKWYKDGSETAMVFDGSNKIVNYNTIQLTDSIKYMSNITLKSFVYTDAGSYSCKATFTGDSSNIPESDVDVKYATVEPGEDGCVFVDYLSSQAKTITCTLKSMETTSGVMFTLPDGSAQAGVLGAVVASEGAVSMREGTLDLTGLTNENDGTYKCSFSLDGGGSVESQMQLTARKAVISHSAGSASNTVQQLATSSLTLTCRVSGSIKELKWLKDDTEMTMNTDYKSVDVTDDGSGDTVEAIKVTIGTSNANYKCQATYFDDQCSTEEDFSSDAVTVTVIQAVPTTQPLSATVTAGSAHTLTCVFPNAFSSQSYVIKWFADEQTIVEQSGSDPVTRGGKTLSTESAGGSITTSLAFADVAQDDGASFVCLIQWGNVAITSDPAVLTVRYLSVKPATTNVVTGEDAVFSCTFTSTADSPESPTVKLHKSSDDSEVVTAVSGVMTMSAVTDSNNGDYYCQATWTGGQTMKSDDVKLYVFTEKTGPASVVWGVKGNMAQFECQADGALQTDDGLGDVVTSSVAWSYKTPSGDWTSTTGVARYTSRTPTVSPTGVLSAKLIVTSLTDADESLMAKCEITYTTDTSKNFVGGTITSTGQTLSLASVTSFTVDNAEPIAGSTITFTCVATGSAEPDFSLSASGLPLQSARMQITSTPAVTASGNTYTQEFVVESKIPNTGGQAITCIADFGRANGKDTADVTVTTYFDCAKAKFRPHTGAGSVTPTINSDGSRTQTLTCPVATTSVKYSDPSPASITCTKTTGVYDDELGDCFKITPSQGETIKQSWNSISNYKICEADAEPGYSVAEINAILTTEDDICGPFPRIACLRSPDAATKCTIDEDATNCSPTDSGFLFTIRVVYTTPSFDRTEPAALDTDSSGKAKKVRFWGCDGARRRRRGIDGSAFEGFLEYQQSNTTILNDADVREESKQESVYMVGIVTSCGVAMMTVLTLFLVLRRQKQVMLERSDSEEVLKA